MQRQCVNLWLPLLVERGKCKLFCLRFVISIWLETRIPAKVSRPSGFYNAPLKIPQESIQNTRTKAQTAGQIYRDRLTSVFPLKSWMGSSFPAEYAKVQRAHADLSSNPARSLYKPKTYFKNNNLKNKNKKKTKTKHNTPQKSRLVFLKKLCIIPECWFGLCEVTVRLLQYQLTAGL